MIQQLCKKLWDGVKPKDKSKVTKLISESAFATSVPFQVCDTHIHTPRKVQHSKSILVLICCDVHQWIGGDRHSNALNVP
jgi:hypothetical protein